LYNFLAQIFVNDGSSLIKELFDYFKDKYFSPNIEDYSNLNITSDDLPSIRMFIIAMFFAVIIASLLAIFNKRVLGDFVRKILEMNCFNKESAKTLTELGFMKNSAIRGSLKNGVTLKRVVRCVEQEEYYKMFGVEVRPVKPLEKLFHGDEEETQASAEAEIVAESEAPTDTPTTVEKEEAVVPKKEFDLNIPPYKIDFTTDHFYIAKEESYMADVKFEAKGANWLAFVAITVISIISALLIFKYLPDILQFVDNFIGVFKPDDNILR